MKKIKVLPLILGLSLLPSASLSREDLKEGGMEDIANFFQITDNIGTGGQPNISQINEIAKANLAMHDSDNAIPGEDKIVTSLGMKYMHIPVPFDAPTSDHLEHFFSAMDSFENDRVFVHCAANYRASVFMYKYLTLRKGVAHEKAASPLLKKWLPTMSDQWKLIIGLEAV
ncbi:MAG: protein tyrosine phosphatase family protein [Rhodospirillales bacterium]